LHPPADENAVVGVGGNAAQTLTPREKARRFLRRHWLTVRRAILPGALPIPPALRAAADLCLAALSTLLK
jgi:hypothetical protein